MLLRTQGLKYEIWAEQGTIKQRRKHNFATSQHALSSDQQPLMFDGHHGQMELCMCCYFVTHLLESVQPLLDYCEKDVPVLRKTILCGMKPNILLALGNLIICNQDVLRLLYRILKLSIYFFFIHYDATLLGLQAACG